jgi:predicted DNA-binding protein
MKTIINARISDELKARIDNINNSTNTKLNLTKIVRSSLEKEVEALEKSLKLKAKN